MCALPPTLVQQGIMMTRGPEKNKSRERKEETKLQFVSKTISQN